MTTWTVTGLLDDDNGDLLVAAVIPGRHMTADSQPSSGNLKRFCDHVEAETADEAEALATGTGGEVAAPAGVVYRYVAEDSGLDDLPTGYMACGDSIALTGASEPGTPAFCPRHGTTEYISVSEWTDRTLPEGHAG